MRDFPEDAQKSWIVDAYQSYSGFVAMFSKPEERDQILAKVCEMDSINKRVLSQPFPVIVHDCMDVSDAATTKNG
jgi:hypothetical protein